MGVIGGEEVAEDDCVSGPRDSNAPCPFSQPHAPCAGTSGHVLTDAVLTTQMDTITAIANITVELREIMIIKNNLLHSQRPFESQGAMKVVKSPNCSPIPSGTCRLPETLEWSKSANGLVLAGFWRLVALNSGPNSGHNSERTALGNGNWLICQSSSCPCGP